MHATRRMSPIRHCYILYPYILYFLNENKADILDSRVINRTLFKTSARLTVRQLRVPIAQALNRL